MPNEPSADTGVGKPAEQDRNELSPTDLAREKAGRTVRPLLVNFAQKFAASETADSDPSLKSGREALAEYRAILTTAPFQKPIDNPVSYEGGNPVILKLKKDVNSKDTLDARVTGVIGLIDDPVNGRVYSVLIEGESTPLSVHENALADALLAAEADEILKLFPEDMTSEKDFLEAYLPLLDQRRKDGDPNPTPIADDILTTMTDKYPESSIVPDAPAESSSSEAPREESMAAQYARANAEIARQITFLEKTIEGLKGDEKKRAQDLLLAMKIAREHNGIFAVFEKGDVLESAKERATEPREKAHLEAAGKRLAPLIEQANTELADFLQQQRLSDETLDELAKIASDPNQGVAKIFERPEVLALPDIEDKINGPDFDQTRFDQIIDDSHLTSEQKAYLKKAGKGAFWVLIAALGIPVALALGSFALTTSVLGKQ